MWLVRGNQLQALGTLFPGAQVRSCVPQGGPPGVLPLQGLHAELHQRSGQGINDQGGGCPSGGHVGGAMLGPLAEPLPPLVAFQLPQQQQMGSAASPHPPVFHPSGSQPAQGLGVMVTPVREPRAAVSTHGEPGSHANGEPGSHAGIGWRGEPSSCWNRSIGRDSDDDGPSCDGS